MKRLTFTLLLLLSLAFQNVYSQSGWFWQNPLPTGSHLESVFFVNENVGYAVGWDGTIIKTTNGGTNWIQRISGNNRLFTSVCFTSADTGYIVSDDEYTNNNIVMLTTNGGTNWETQFTFINCGMRDIFFVNQSTGFICGRYYYMGGRIFKTTNAGINWIQYGGPTTTNAINSLFFININNGFATGEDGHILRTTDGGNNWINLNPGPGYPEFRSIYFTNDSTGYVVGGGTSGSNIYKSTNYGNNWFALAIVNNSMWDIKFLNNYTGFVVVGQQWAQQYGKILKTTNQGISWDSILTNTESNLRSISILDQNSVLTVGWWGSIAKSTDLGLNWIEITHSGSNLDFNSMVFSDLNTGYIFGSYGSILKTTDGANNWTQQSSNTTEWIWSSALVNSQLCYASCSKGLLLKTSNGGINWIVYNTGSNNYMIFSIYFINPHTGFAASNYSSWGYRFSRIFKTTNNGVSWETNLNRSCLLYSVFFLNNDTGFAVGDTVLRTFDCGITWHSTPTGTNSAFRSVYFLNNQTGFCGGSINQQWASYSLIKTTNCGNNWSWINISLPYRFYITSIIFIDSYTGFLTCLSFPDYGRSGDIFKTTDGGMNWYHFSTFPTFPTVRYRGLNSAVFINNATGFVAGEHGTILKTTNGGNLIGVTRLAKEIPNSFSLSQNYPNPFNPVTKIKYSLPNPSKGRAVHVKLIIYDILGREIQTLVNENKKPGNYEVDWDGSRYSSGVYFYRLVTDDFVETKKLILMK